MRKSEDESTSVHGLLNESLRYYEAIRKPKTYSNDSCYDMEVGESRVHVFYGTKKREKEKDSRYIQEASAPAAVTVYQTCNIMYICNNS
jgi:hypothetical protein